MRTNTDLDRNDYANSVSAEKGIIYFCMVFSSLGRMADNAFYSFVRIVIWTASCTKNVSGIWFDLCVGNFVLLP